MSDKISSSERYQKFKAEFFKNIPENTTIANEDEILCLYLESINKVRCTKGSGIGVASQLTPSEWNEVFIPIGAKKRLQEASSKFQRQDVLVCDANYTPKYTCRGVDDPVYTINEVVLDEHTTIYTDPAVIKNDEIIYLKEEEYYLLPPELQAKLKITMEKMAEVEIAAQKLKIDKEKSGKKSNSEKGVQQRDLLYNEDIDLVSFPKKDGKLLVKYMIDPKMKDLKSTTTLIKWAFAVWNWALNDQLSAVLVPWIADETARTEPYYLFLPREQVNNLAAAAYPGYLNKQQSARSFCFPFKKKTWYKRSGLCYIMPAFYEIKEKGQTVKQTKAKKLGFLIHELGHTFGLGHPHESAITSKIFKEVTTKENPKLLNTDSSFDFFSVMLYQWRDFQSNIPLQLNSGIIHGLIKPEYHISEEHSLMLFNVACKTIRCPSIHDRNAVITKQKLTPVVEASATIADRGWFMLKGGKLSISEEAATWDWATPKKEALIDSGPTAADFGSSGLNAEAYRIHCNTFESFANGAGTDSDP